jgi:hypothetical protein
MTTQLRTYEVTYQGFDNDDNSSTFEVTLSSLEHTLDAEDVIQSFVKEAEYNESCLTKIWCVTDDTPIYDLLTDGYRH